MKSIASAAAGVLLAAAPVAAQDYLQLKLDCSVSVDRHFSSERYQILPGRERQTADAGTWRVEVGHLPGVDTTAQFMNAAPFPIVGTDIAKSDYLEGFDSRHARVTDDRIEWCPSRRGCDTQISVGDGDWYRVGRAVIDRRRATVAVTVSTYIRVLGRSTVDVYQGTCAPEPERQF